MADDRRRPGVPATAPPRPAPSARGWTVRDFCEREKISRATCRRWIEKGVLQVSRVGPKTGVRVHYNSKGE